MAVVLLPVVFFKRRAVTFYFSRLTGFNVAFTKQKKSSGACKRISTRNYLSLFYGKLLSERLSAQGFWPD
jgi:hypothetical protein